MGNIESATDQKLIALIKSIIAKGDSVEVKQATDGGYIVYVVKKKKFVIKNKFC